jgi:hypothetical protein
MKSEEFAQNLEYPFEVLCVKMRDDMCIQDGLLFMWDVVPSFQNVFR